MVFTFLKLREFKAISLMRSYELGCVLLSLLGRWGPVVVVVAVAPE